MLSVSKSTVFAVAAIGVLLAIGIDTGTEFVSLQIKKSIARADEAELLPSGADDHSELRMAFNSAGVTDPEFETIENSKLSPTTPVVGIEVEGEAVAFPLAELEEPHIVNAVIGKRALSVTYCTLVDCVRVLTDESEKPIDLRLGGQDGNMQMVFMYDGARYAQESQKIPLNDFPFKRCSLAEWKKLHPQTEVFIAPKT